MSDDERTLERIKSYIATTPLPNIEILVNGKPRKRFRDMNNPYKVSDLLDPALKPIKPRLMAGQVYRVKSRVGYGATYVVLRIRDSLGMFMLGADLSLSTAALIDNPEGTTLNPDDFEYVGTLDRIQLA